MKRSLITAFLAIAMASAQGVQGRHPVHDVDGLSGKNVLVAWASSKSSNQVAPADSLATLLGPRSRFTSMIFNTDHGFTDKRVALTREYLAWLRSKAPARARLSQPN